MPRNYIKKDKIPPAPRQYRRRKLGREPNKPTTVQLRLERLEQCQIDSLMNALIDQHYLKENQALQIALENFNESMIDYLKKRLKNRVTHAANNVPKTR